MITVSVPGKIHLMGEHAVVHGKPALLAAINKRMRVSIEQASTMNIVTTESPACVIYALEKVKEYFKLDALPPMHISIDSDIPAGFHLGSSAATAVGVVAAAMYFLKKLWNPIQINALAYEVEKKQHGNPSGGDNTAVSMGGFVWFRKELEFLKSMWQLEITIPSTLNHFYLIDSGRPKETTGEMVSLVRKRVQEKPAFMEKVFSQNETQTKRIAVALKENIESELIAAMNVGERTLEDMGVVGKKVTPCIRAIEKAGGAVKILGGGGKKDGVGFLLGYHRNESVLRDMCTKYNFPIQRIQLGCVGVTLERKE